MRAQRGLVVARFVRQHFQRQSAGLIRKQRQFKIVHRAGRQGVGHRLDTVNIQNIIKNFNIEHRAKQRLIARRFAAIAHDLFGVVTLVATHLFQLGAETQRQLRQGLLPIDMYRQRQDVQYRAGCGQCRRAHPPHKDKARSIVHAVA